jgi:hypothetical protein
MADRPAELIRQAVIRDGHRCSICGRPCSEKEARRHSEPGAFGDSSMNFAAMCYGCQTWLAHQGARPAQYIVHAYDRSKLQQQLRIVADRAIVILFAGTYTAFAVFAAAIIYWTPHNVLTVLASCVLTFYLLHLGTTFLNAFREGRRSAGSAPNVHPRFDEQTIQADRQR